MSESYFEGDYETLAKVKSAICNIFILADTSGSMRQNGNIHQLNTAIQELKPKLSGMQSDDVEIHIGVCTFGSDVRWRTEGQDGTPAAVPVSSFVWSDVQAKAYTPMGKAFSLLDEAMSRQSFFKNDVILRPPVVLMITDGDPTDEWEEPLKKLKGNKWFKRSYRVVIGPEVRNVQNVLEEFTDNPQSILPYFGSTQDSLKKLGKLIEACIARTTQYSSSIIMPNTNRMDQDASSEEIICHETGEIVQSVIAEQGGWDFMDEDFFEDSPNPVTDDEADDSSNDPASGSSDNTDKQEEETIEDIGDDDLIWSEF